MSGLNALLDALHAERTANQDSVLATVVKVEGSAYRRPGARMLVSRYGNPEGTISGGCLEAEVTKKAWWLTESGPVVRSYSTAVDDEDGEESLSFGLGCNGKVFVLFERLPAKENSLLLEALYMVRDKQRPAAIATVITAGPNSRARLGERLLLMPDQSYSGSLRHLELAERISRDLKLTLERGKSWLCCYTDAYGEVEVFLEYLAPPQRLVIFGAGHDAQPLARMAKLLGWHVTVIDGRSHFARSERFPDADLVLTADPSSPFAFANLVRGAAVVVMTHSLTQDSHWLRGVLHSQPHYVGQLGPRDRTERLLAGFSADGNALPALHRLHYPMGLDLGGDTPESVAMSVLAEISASVNGRAGGSLKLRATKIHEPDPVAFAELDSEVATFARLSHR